MLTETRYTTNSQRSLSQNISCLNSLCRDVSSSSLSFIWRCCVAEVTSQPSSSSHLWSRNAELLPLEAVFPLASFLLVPPEQRRSAAPTIWGSSDPKNRVVSRTVHLFTRHTCGLTTTQLAYGDFKWPTMMPWEYCWRDRGGLVPVRCLWLQESTHSKRFSEILCKNGSVYRKWDHHGFIKYKLQHYTLPVPAVGTLVQLFIYKACAVLSS